MKHHKLDTRVNKLIRLNYLLHIPEQFQPDSDELWPTILFLHGHGESGDDTAVLMQQGLPKQIAAQPDFPFIVIAPQCPWQTWWPELADEIDAEHDSWTETYANPQLYRWFLAHRL